MGFLSALVSWYWMLFADILGIQAEISQNKVKDLKTWEVECRDPSYEAFKLGLAGGCCNSVGVCTCNCSLAWKMILHLVNNNTKQRSRPLAFLIFSWIVLGVAFPMLITGTLANLRSRESCGISNNRFLSIGGILCFIHALFNVACYVSVTASRKEEKRKQSPN